MEQGAPQGDSATQSGGFWSKGNASVHIAREIKAYISNLNLPSHCDIVVLFHTLL